MIFVNYWGANYFSQGSGGAPARPGENRAGRTETRGLVGGTAGTSVNGERSVTRLVLGALAIAASVAFLVSGCSEGALAPRATSTRTRPVAETPAARATAAPAKRLGRRRSCPNYPEVPHRLLRGSPSMDLYQSRSSSNSPRGTADPVLPGRDAGPGRRLAGAIRRPRPNCFYYHSAERAAHKNIFIPADEKKSRAKTLPGSKLAAQLRF